MGTHPLMVLAVGLITYSVVASGAGSRKTTAVVSFPSAHNRAISPDGQLAVVNVDSDAEPHHTLLLENRRTKERRKLLDYGRHVEILWNPNSTSFAVTDYAGSNVAECLVFSVTDVGSPQNVGDALLTRIKNPKELSTLRDSSHIYWTAVQWASSRALITRVRGHTDMTPSHAFQFVHTYYPKAGT